MPDFNEDEYPCSALFEPIELHSRRAMVAAELDTIIALADHLDVDGLQAARQRLKSPSLLAVIRTGGTLAVGHAELLSALCKALAARTGMPVEYFIGAGDMLPEVPDFPPDFGGSDVR